MQLFYVPDVSDGEIVLDEAESRHAIRVLRLEKGSYLHITDGIGGLFTAEITDPHPKKCRLYIVDRKQNYGKRNFELHIAIAPTKNSDRLEWFLEKTTEIGIDRISFLLCDNSERRVIKRERLEKVVISAMKQSLKAYMPEIGDLYPYHEFVRNTFATRRLIAHCQGDNKPHLKDKLAKKDSLVIMIGPEGDFSLEEIELAKEVGYSEVSLGNSRLRTETAGIVACSIANLVNE